MPVSLDPDPSTQEPEGVAVKGLAGTAVKHAEWHGSPVAERGPDCPRCVGRVHAADSSGLVRQPEVRHPASGGRWVHDAA